MDIQYLKDYINENNLISTVLEKLGCHHISQKSGYITCGNPDGNRQNAITVYQNDNLTVVDYTRNLKKSNTNLKQSKCFDLIDLVEYFEKCNFFYAIKKVCDWINLDYYVDPLENVPESLRITKLIMDLTKGESEYDEDTPIKPISEKILTYYHKWVNDLFFKDNISYLTQREFEVGYDDATNRITIPIRDELGTLVGVKGRLLSNELTEEEYKVKYLYIEPCNRSKLLYGIHKTAPYITNKGCVYVTESEKGVMQLWDMGFCNAVATYGKKITQNQIDKLTRLCVDIIFLFDKDVGYDEIVDIANKFIDGVRIYAVIDRNNILEEKESPTDNNNKFKVLIENYCERIR